MYAMIRMLVCECYHTYLAPFDRLMVVRAPFLLGDLLAMLKWSVEYDPESVEVRVLK